MKLPRRPRPFKYELRNIPACVQKLMDRGLERDEAEDSCRGQQPGSQNPGNDPKDGAIRGVAENAASSVIGPGMYSGYGQLGTGTVSFPDAAKNADAYRKGLGRKVVNTDRAGWEEYASRLNMMPDDVAKGWNIMTRGSAEEAVDAVFGESTSWSGYWIPSPNMISIQQPEAPVDGKGGGGGSGGTGFPFRTAAAEKIFQKASRLILLHPELNAHEILRRAIEDANVKNSELTPEDEQLLLIAVQFLQNGPARSDVRTGGTPGGPFRSTDRSAGTP